DQYPLSGWPPRWTNRIRRAAPDPRNIRAPTPGNGCLGYLRRIGNESFHVEAHAKHRGSRRDEERLIIDIAEGEIGGSLGKLDLIQLVAFGRVDEDLAARDIQVAFLIGAQAGGDSGDALDEHAIVRGRPRAVQIKRMYGSRVGVGYIQDA